MRKILPHKALLWTILAGIAYVLCFPRWDLPSLSVLVMPGLIFAIHDLKSRRQALGCGLLFSAMVAWGGFPWIIYVTENFGGSPVAVAVLILCLFSLVAAPQVVAFFLLGERLRFRIEQTPLPLRPLFWTALYTGLEYLAHFLKIFPEHLGNTLLAFPRLAQSASLGGVGLLSFLPLWIGASLAYLRKSGLRAWPSLAASILLPLLLTWWGNGELEYYRQVDWPKLRVGFVQQNQEEIEKIIARMPVRDAINLVVRTVVERTQEFLRRPENRPDLLVWPETAYPMPFPVSPDTPVSSFASGYANLLKDVMGSAHIPLLFGGYETVHFQDYNSGILLGPTGQPEASYRKRVLLIFGEFVPFSDWFPALKKLNPDAGNFGRGEGPIPIPFTTVAGRKLLLGVNICYEEIIPEYMRGYVERGAQVFVNLTKDSWFGDTFEPWEHFQLSAIRAIEHRIPLVRSTNTGLSGIVSAAGDVQLLSEPFHTAAAVMEVAVPDKPPMTPYTRFGDWVAWLCLVLSAGIPWIRRT